MNDLHIHTKFSCDSDAEMKEYIENAIHKGMNSIGFTDHVDMNQNDYGYNYYNSSNFFEEFHRLKSLYQEKITILAGIEFGEPHLYPDELDKLVRLPYDYVIGSIHWIGDMFPCQKVREEYSAREFYSLYWKEVLKTVKHGGFQVLGHMDFPKRYYGEIYYEEAVMKEIFKRLLEQDIVPEINSSSIRKGHHQTMPGKELLQIYKDCGGNYITIGSDAHEIKDLAADNEAAKELSKSLGLQEVIFINRIYCQGYFIII